jgi:hypothetical protein
MIDGLCGLGCRGTGGCGGCNWKEQSINDSMVSAALEFCGEGLDWVGGYIASDGLQCSEEPSGQ